MSKRSGYRGTGEDGYADPTAREAINNVSRAERREHDRHAAVDRGDIVPGDLADRVPGPSQRARRDY